MWSCLTVITTTVKCNFANRCVVTNLWKNNKDKMNVGLFLKDKHETGSVSMKTQQNMSDQLQRLWLSLPAIFNDADVWNVSSLSGFVRKAVDNRTAAAIRDDWCKRGVWLRNRAKWLVGMSGFIQSSARGAYQEMSLHSCVWYELPFKFSETLQRKTKLWEYLGLLHLPS